jgi:hypothetical protein
MSTQVSVFAAAFAPLTGKAKPKSAWPERGREQTASTEACPNDEVSAWTAEEHAQIGYLTVNHKSAESTPRHNGPPPTLGQEP